MSTKEETRAALMAACDSLDQVATALEMARAYALASLAYVDVALDALDDDRSADVDQAIQQAQAAAKELCSRVAVGPSALKHASQDAAATLGAALPHGPVH